ncbi:MAG: hypothetical protein ACJAW0_001952 [Zhongshania sp.]
MDLHVTTHPEPPVALVKTWITLFTSDQDQEVKDRASEMLLKAFGDMKAVAAFVEKHKIQLR